MPEQKSRFLEWILDTGEQEQKGFPAERQHTAEAFNLHVERRDGSKPEGFAWSHHTGYQWTDDGAH